MTGLVLGMDVGGTSSRALIADLTGRVVGRGVAGGGNPISRGMGPAMAAIEAALNEALAGVDGHAVDPAALQGSVIGAAGFGHPLAHDALGVVWAGLGLPSAPHVVGDVEVAFASATDALDGSVVVSGTGAIAASIVDGALGAVSDGVGWLLGDHGSGFWVGREAIRRAVSPRRDPADPLGPEVARWLTGQPEIDRLALVAAAYALEPVRLSELTGIVLAAADAGSGDARTILDDAADELVETVAAIREQGETSVIVLGGGLLATPPLHARVEDRLGRVWPAAPLRRTGSGVGGAAWLAARSLGVELPVHLHATLSSTSSTSPTSSTSTASPTTRSG